MKDRPSRAIEELRSWASTLHAEAPPRRSLREPVPDAPIPARRPIQAIALAATVAVLMTIGVGALADEATPGDLLYPIDRAGEWLVDLLPGDVDRGPERAREALVLVDRGDTDGAIDLLAAYAERQESHGADVGSLKARLEDLRSSQGPGMGREVSEIARSLGASVDTPGQGGDPATPPSTPGQGD